MHSDRRKLSRNTPIHGSHITIRSTIGAPGTFTFRICDSHERGLSFLIPRQTGYFIPGTPILFSTGNSPAEEYFGIVKHVQPLSEPSGTEIYRTGIEILPRPKNSTHSSQKLRPSRIQAVDNDTDYIALFIDNSYITLPLLDISAYAASFTCDPELRSQFEISMRISQLSISMKGRNIFTGSGIVTRLYTDRNNIERIVVQPEKELFNISAVENSDLIASNVASAVAFIRDRITTYAPIDAGFRLAVTELKLFLEKSRQYLDERLICNTSDEETEFLEKFDEFFYPELESHVRHLDTILPELSLDEEGYHIYKKYFQDQLHDLLMQAPFCRRMFTKPLGYAGDFEMMRMIRHNSLSGPTRYFKLVNKHVLKNSMSQANRNRNDYLCQKLADLIGKHPADEKINILSVASGPAHEFIDLIAAHPGLSGRIKLTLLDQEIRALKYSQEKIYEQCIVSDFKLKVDFIHKSIQQFIKDHGKNSRNSFSFDIIYCFGLFDYFDDRSAARILNYFTRFLKNASGKILISNYSLDGHFHRTYLEMAFEWFMVYRDTIALSSLASKVDNVKSYSIEEEPLGVIKFLQLEL